MLPENIFAFLILESASQRTKREELYLWTSVKPGSGVLYNCTYLGTQRNLVSIRQMEITQVMVSKGTKQCNSFRLGKDVRKLQPSAMSG